MDKKSVKEYIDLLEESNLTSLKIKTDKGELHLTKEQKLSLAQNGNTIVQPPVLENRVKKKPKNTINAPIVGTFYRASGPNKKAYVSVGDRVEVGDVVCILEAMKTMNEIKSEKSGIVKEILIDDAMSVEFDQPLFVLE